MSRFQRQSTLYAHTRDVEEHGGVTLRPHHRTDEHYTKPERKSRTKKRKSSTPSKSPRGSKKVKHWSKSLERSQVAALKAINVKVGDLVDVDEKPAPLWTADEVQEWASDVAGESLKNVPAVATDIDGPELVALGSATAAADALFPSGVSKTVGKRVWSRLEKLRTATPAKLRALAQPQSESEEEEEEEVKPTPKSAKKPAKKPAALPSPGVTFVAKDPKQTSQCYSVSALAYFAFSLLLDLIVLNLIIAGAFGVKECAASYNTGAGVGTTCFESGAQVGLAWTRGHAETVERFVLSAVPQFT